MVRTKYRSRRSQVSPFHHVYICARRLTGRTLTNSFSPCGLAVATATDSMIYKSDVYAASNLPSTGWFDDDSESTPTTLPTAASKRSSSERGKVWGDKAVLILVGLRLGLDGVNPIYYDSIKVSFNVHGRRRQ